MLYPTRLEAVGDLLARMAGGLSGATGKSVRLAHVGLEGLGGFCLDS